MSDIECPYCDHEQEVCHDDGQGYDESILHEMQCYECEKSFVFSTSISYHYEPEKADCLNDGNHKYLPTKTYPKSCTRMECASCGDKRQPTDEEKARFSIPPMPNDKMDIE